MTITAPYQKHSDTSITAAAEIEPALNKLQRKVLGFLRSQRETGATDEEMQIHLDMNPSTQRPRRIELVARGKVYDSGKKRKTHSGRLAVVWRVL